MLISLDTLGSRPSSQAIISRFLTIICTMHNYRSTCTARGGPKGRDIYVVNVDALCDSVGAPCDNV